MGHQRDEYIYIFICPSLLQQDDFILGHTKEVAHTLIIATTFLTIKL